MRTILEQSRPDPATFADAVAAAMPVAAERIAAEVRAALVCPLETMVELARRSADDREAAAADRAAAARDREAVAVDRRAIEEAATRSENSARRAEEAARIVAAAADRHRQPTEASRGRGRGREA